MSYLVLARKYRPQSFTEVTGQEVVTKTLQGAIDEGRVAHAYLLCGPRGTGKTTTARLFAKALNCEKGPIAEPCGECARCLAAEAGNETDLIEIDAASHTGVENVRELRDQAAYAPLRARHKVYLIDEVHMLSKPAFNALLKTLEEPPSHVKFLFATTEPHKVPDTILSRCQVLKLSALSEDAIETRLNEVFRLEGVQAEPGVSAAIARRARGGMRDALSLADQLLALVGDAPTVADTARLSAGVDREGIERLVSAVVRSDRPALLDELGAGTGGESELVEALLEYLRGCLLCAHCGEDNPLSDAPKEARAAMARLAGELGPERVELMLEELLHARDQIRLLPGQARLTVELALLRLARPEATVPLAALAQRLLALEARLASGAPTPAAPAASGDTLVPQAAPASGAPDARRQPPTRPDAPAAGAPPAAAPAAAPRPSTQTRPSGDARPSGDGGPAGGEARATGEGRPPRRDEPAPAPTRSRPAFEGAVRSSNGEAWNRFLEELQAKAPALASVVGGQGRLVELAGGRAVVRFDRLRQADRPLVQDARNQKLCTRLFSELMGTPIDVRLEDGAQMRPGNEDEFTQKVVDLFEGRVED